jgi:hypothetical protein
VLAVAALRGGLGLVVRVALIGLLTVDDALLVALVALAQAADAAVVHLPGEPGLVPVHVVPDARGARAGLVGHPGLPVVLGPVDAELEDTAEVLQVREEALGAAGDLAHHVGVEVLVHHRALVHRQCDQKFGLLYAPGLELAELLAQRGEEHGRHELLVLDLRHKVDPVPLVLRRPRVRGLQASLPARARALLVV